MPRQDNFRVGGYIYIFRSSSQSNRVQRYITDRIGRYLDRQHSKDFYRQDLRTLEAPSKN